MIPVTAEQSIGERETKETIESTPALPSWLTMSLGPDQGVIAPKKCDSVRSLIPTHNKPYKNPSKALIECPNMFQLLLSFLDHHQGTSEVAFEAYGEDYM